MSLRSRFAVGLMFAVGMAIGVHDSSWAASRTASLPAPCLPSALSVKERSAPGARIVVAQFASHSKSVAKFLPALSDKYAESVRVILKEPLRSLSGFGALQRGSKQDAGSVLLVPCSIATQTAAAQLVKEWQVEAILWGLVGVEEAPPQHPAQSASSAAGSVPAAGTGNVSVSGTVVTTGSSLTCIGNNNDCRLYMFQAHGHPLQEPVVPILTLREPAVSQDWDHDDSIKHVSTLPKAEAVTAISRVQRAMLLGAVARAAMAQKRYEVAYHSADSSMKQLEPDDRLPLGSEPYRIMAHSALDLDNEQSEERALSALEKCPELDTPEQPCRGVIWNRIGMRYEQQRGPASGAYEKALVHLEQANDTPGAVLALRRLAWLAIQHGQPAVAEQRYRQALGLVVDQASEARTAAMVRNDLALLIGARGNTSEARTLFEQAIATHAQLKNPYGEALAHYNLAFLFRARGDFSAAVREFLRASECYEQVTPPATREALESVVEATYLSRRTGKDGPDSAVEQQLFRLRSLLAANTSPQR
jgi:hypothetical protein